MKNALLALSFVLLSLAQTVTAQVVTECKGVVNPSNRLWEEYSQDTRNPSVLPDKIPLNVSYPGLIKKEINPNYNELESAVKELAAGKGGVISFKNLGSGKTISFARAIEITRRPVDPCVTILIEGADKVTFDGGRQSSMFIIRRSVKVIFQNIVFQNGMLKRNIIEDRKQFRVGGGAVEVTAGAALRTYNCQFLNNRVDEWNDRPGGGYDGVGENQNGAGIRFNYHTTGEVYKTTFRNCQAVTGGAIGATSVNKITIMDCVFDKNIATSYNTKSSTNRRVVEGAGALRVDRTAKPLEIYRTVFKENASNLKSSVLVAFIRPLRDRGQETGPYPSPSQFALIIDGCTFDSNKFNNFKGAVDAKRDFFSGPILFHGGRIDGNFRGAKMKITNTTFNNNEVGESNVRSFLDFEISNSIFANTKILRLPKDNGQFGTGKGAIALRGEVPNRGIIDNCTFYNNEPNPQDPQNHEIASDIFFWRTVPAQKFRITNSIFYRKNTNAKVNQVSFPLPGSNNVQFVPGANMAAFSNVSQSGVQKVDPNIAPNTIVDMCLGSNTLPKGIGGLPDCGSDPDPTPVPNPPTPTTPSTQLVADGTYVLESTTSTQRLYSKANHQAFMEDSSTSDSQKWEFKHLGDDVYTIKNVGTKRYLEVPFARCANAIQIGTWTGSGSDHQRWKIEANGEGVFSLKPAHCTDQALDRNFGRIDTNVHTYSFWPNNSNQKWKIIPLNTALRTNESSEVQLFAFPNPANDVVTLSGIELGDRIEVYSVSGKRMLEVNATQAQETLDLSRLPRGLYIVSILGKESIKVVLE